MFLGFALFVVAKVIGRRAVYLRPVAGEYLLKEVAFDQARPRRGWPCPPGTGRMRRITRHPL